MVKQKSLEWRVNSLQHLLSVECLLEYNKINSLSNETNVTLNNSQIIKNCNLQLLLIDQNHY